MEDLFKASDWLNNDTLCINDRNNGVLVANHELPEATENAVTELIKSSGSRKFDEAAHRTSKEEHISIISSTYENWDIAVILKEQAFASKIIDIQKLLAVVVIIYLLLTVAVIANSAAKRYLKLRNIVQVLHRGNAADPEENLTDAFAYIDSRVQKLVQDNVESSDLIEQQRTVMLREQFSRDDNERRCGKRGRYRPAGKSRLPDPQGKTVLSSGLPACRNRILRTRRILTKYMRCSGSYSRM